MGTGSEGPGPTDAMASAPTGAAGTAPTDAGAPRPVAAGALDLAIAAGLWGGLYAISSATFSTIPPITLNALRLVVGVAVLAIVFRGDLGFRRTEPRRVLLAGVVVAVTMACQFTGTALTGAAEAALLTTTTPAFVLLFGVALEGQRVRPAAWLGVAVALGGVALIALRRGAGDPADGTILGLPSAIVGDLLLIGAASSWALFSSVGRPLVARVGAFRAIVQASTVGLVLLLPLVPLELSRSPIGAVDGTTVLAILYLGVGATAIGWSLWYRGYASTPATVAAAAFFTQPLVGAVLGVGLLGESLDAAFVVGAALIVVGVLTIATIGRRPMRRRADGASVG